MMLLGFFICCVGFFLLGLFFNITNFLIEAKKKRTQAEMVIGKVGTIVKNITTAKKKNYTLYDRVLNNGYASSKELDILKRGSLE